MNRHGSETTPQSTRPDIPVPLYAGDGHDEIVRVPPWDVAELEEASRRGYLLINCDSPSHGPLAAAFRARCASQWRNCIEVRRLVTEAMVALDMETSFACMDMIGVASCTRWLLDHGFQQDQFEVSPERIVVRRVPIHRARWLAEQLGSDEPYGECWGLEYYPDPPRQPHWLWQLTRGCPSEEELYRAVEARETRERERDEARIAEEAEWLRRSMARRQGD